MKNCPQQSEDYDINRPSDNDNKSSASGQWRWLGIALGVLLVLSIFNNVAELSHEEIPYSQFLKTVKDNQVESVVINEKYMIGKLKDGE